MVFIESIWIPVASIVYASIAVDNKTTFDSISTALGGFALGIAQPARNNTVANYLFRLRKCYLSSTPTTDLMIELRAFLGCLLDADQILPIPF